MTPATASSSGPNLFSTVTGQSNGLYSANRQTFVLSLVGQALILTLLVYFTGCVIRATPNVVRPFHDSVLPLILSGSSGGGGGNFERLPASHGDLPRPSLDQFVPPTVKVPTEMPKLVAEETVVVAPDVKYPQASQTGDPNSPFTRWLSDGQGGPGGIGKGCCDGIGDFRGPHVGSGPPGIYPAGKDGATIPEAIYSPEPNFSDEARKSKQQGLVGLLLVVGPDGRTYNIRVRQSLGMGLDEKAIEAVSRWRFKPATRNGKPVATEIAIEVEFHLY